MKVERNREIRKNENTGKFEYIEYSTTSGRTLKVLMIGYDFTTRRDMEMMIKGFEEVAR